MSDDYCGPTSSDTEQITFEALSPPLMTSELAAALAALVRAALARRSGACERAA